MIDILVAQLTRHLYPLLPGYEIRNSVDIDVRSYREKATAAYFWKKQDEDVELLVRVKEIGFFRSKFLLKMKICSGNTLSERSIKVRLCCERSDLKRVQDTLKELIDLVNQAPEHAVP